MITEAGKGCHRESGCEGRPIAKNMRPQKTKFAQAVSSNDCNATAVSLSGSNTSMPSRCAARSNRLSQLHKTSLASIFRSAACKFKHERKIMASVALTLCCAIKSRAEKTNLSSIDTIEKVSAAITSWLKAYIACVKSLGDKRPSFRLRTNTETISNTPIDAHII